MRYTVVFVRFGLRKMEDDALAYLVRSTDAREWSLRVVDNWENPETLTELWDRVIREEYQGSPCRARNVGDRWVPHGHGHAVVLLNSDCWLGPGWAKEFDAAFAADDAVAVVGPYANEGPQTAPAEIRAPRRRECGWPDMDDVDRAAMRCRELWGGKSREGELFGFCYALRLDCAAAVGGLAWELAQGYTLYGSEQSLSRRLREGGRKTAVAMGAYAYHLGEASGQHGERKGVVDLLAERERGRRLFSAREGCR